MAQAVRARELRLASTAEVQEHGHRVVPVVGDSQVDVAVAPIREKEQALELVGDNEIHAAVAVEIACDHGRCVGFGCTVAGAIEGWPGQLEPSCKPRALCGLRRGGVVLGEAGLAEAEITLRASRPDASGRKEREREARAGRMDRSQRFGSEDRNAHLVPARRPVTPASCPMPAHWRRSSGGDLQNVDEAI